MVSICVLTYNHERYIGDCIMGLLSQEYNDNELVILDDNSQDNTVCIIEKYMDRLKAKYRHVRFIKHTVNVGKVSQNCNEMIKAASGKYIKLFSGDDIMLNNCIRTLVEILEKRSDIGIVYTNQYIVDDNYRFGDKLDFSNMFFRDKLPGCEKELFRHLMRGCFIGAASTMIRKEIYDIYGLYDESIPVEDYEFWLRVSRKVRFYYSDIPTTCYRRAVNSMTNYYQGDGKRKIDSIIQNEQITISKYIYELDENEQRDAWNSFYARYSRFAKDIGYLNKSEALESQIIRYSGGAEKNNNGIGIYYDRRIEYLKKWIEKDVVNSNWINEFVDEYRIKKVAIYGLACLGVLLVRRLSELGINVVFGIDRGADFITAEFEVYTYDSIPSNSDIDLIIVSIIDESEKIKDLLQSQYRYHVVTIADILG